MPSIRDASAVVVNGGVESMRYGLFNSSNSSLIAVEIWWDVYTAEGVGHLVSREDNWVTKIAILPPGSFETRPYDGFIKSRSGKITRIVAQVEYAEFADGRKIGDKSTLAAFAAERSQFRTTIQSLQQVYWERGAEGFVAALARQTKDTIPQRAAKARLREIHRTEGLPAALSEVARILSLG
jgi:hypothetical protein